MITQLKNIPEEPRGGYWYSRSELASAARIEPGKFSALVTGKPNSWKGWAQAGIEISTRKRDLTTKALVYYYLPFTPGTAMANSPNSMNSAAGHAANENFKPKALLEPEAGPARKKPRFRPALS
jgi:hypothetical protein